MSSIFLSIYPVLFLCLCAHISTVCGFVIYKRSKNLFWPLFLDCVADHFQRYTFLWDFWILFPVFCFTKFICRYHIPFSSLLILTWSKIWKGLTCNWIALDSASVTYLIVDLQLDDTLTCMYSSWPKSQFGVRIHPLQVSSNRSAFLSNHPPPIWNMESYHTHPILVPSLFYFIVYFILFYLWR